MDPYEEYMMNYGKPAAPAVPVASAVSGLSAALPWVGAGLQTAGLISSLYGAYKGSQQADQNYELQKKEFEYQRGMEAEKVKREQEQQALVNSYTAANKSQSDEDRLMSKYAPYYRSIGL